MTGERPGGGRLFWAGAAAGWAVMGAGVWGLVAEADRTRPADAARFALGLVVVHDLVLAPLVVLVGWGVARLVPPGARGPVQAALVVSAVVLLFAAPFVRGYGRVSTNPSILPRHYGRGTAVVVAAVWGAAGAVLARRWWRRRRAGPGAGVPLGRARTGDQDGPA